MNRRKAYSFRLLRAFEGWKDDKDVSWYSKWKFVMNPDDEDTIHEMETAKEVIRSITVGELFQQMRTLEKMFDVSMKWNDNTKLGEVMTELNRKNAGKYQQTVRLLENWSKFNHPELAKALKFLNENALYMERDYLAKK